MTKASVWIAAAVMLLYFVFTSGVVFKVTDCEIIDMIDTPHSKALSGEQLGTIAVFSKDDMRCADWLTENAKWAIPIVVGSNSILIFTKDGPSWHHIAANNASWINVPRKCYLFVSTWNSQHGEWIRNVGVGTRAREPLPEFDGIELFRSGEAAVYKIGF